jgi:hypothetical protein
MLLSGTFIQPDINSRVEQRPTVESPPTSVHCLTPVSVRPILIPSSHPKLGFTRAIQIFRSNASNSTPYMNTLAMSRASRTAVHVSHTTSRSFLKTALESTGIRSYTNHTHSPIDRNPELNRADITPPMAPLPPTVTPHSRHRQDPG